jgi:hypothetical protein
VTALIDPNSATRLAKILGMLGSNHDGERASAAAKADAMVRSMGLTWPEVIALPARPAAPPASPRSSPIVWGRMAMFCYARQAQMNARERQFIASMLVWRGEPSEKQRDWLIDLYSRLSGTGR